MVRNIRVIWAMVIHFVTTFFRRRTYSVENKTLTPEEKRIRRKKIYHMQQELTGRMLKAAGTTVHIKGKENLPSKGPAVYMATHKGLFDTPILVNMIDDPLIFIGKEEMKKLPIVGHWFNATGSIYISRDDLKQSLEAILTGIKELKEGQSVVIFPEGTRHKGEGMGQFKPGSFKLATKANVPIVPIAIQNSHKILEEKGRVTKAEVYVNIGKAVEVASLTEEEKKSLPKTVQYEVERLLKEATKL